MRKLGLVDSTDIDDFRIKLESVKSVWDNLYPGFHKWFSKKRASFFEQSVIEIARTGKKGIVADVISTLKKLVDRHEDDKVRAIYGSGPYCLSTQYAKF